MGLDAGILDLLDALLQLAAPAKRVRASKSYVRRTSGIVQA